MPELKPRSKIIDRGQITLGLANLQIPVTLGKRMPSTAYTVYTRTVSGTTVAVSSVTNKSATGFTLNLTLGVVAVIEWIAVED